MKNAIFIAALLSCTQVSATEVPAPTKLCVYKPATTGTFAFFRGHRQGKTITVTWGMTSNAGIEQFIIECTYEDPTDPYAFWATKGIVNNTNLRSFKFNDNNSVYPGTMHYRITAIAGNAPAVVSPIETIRIVSH